jgi:hypothetical protein
MKKHILTIVLLFTFASYAVCQDLLIRYDFVNKNIYFFKIKKSKDGTMKLVSLKNPRVKPNRNVKIQYININPFIWNQPHLNLVTTNQDSISSSNPFAMLMPSSFSGGGLGSLGMGFSRDASALTPQQQVCAVCLESLYKAYDEINALKLNYKLTKQQILDQSRAKIRSVIRSCGPTIHIDTTRAEFKAADFAALNAYFKDLCPMAASVTSRSAGDSKMDAFLGTTGLTANELEVLPNDALTNIAKNYLTVSDADFTYENSFIVSDKDVVLHMDFTLTDEYKKKAAKDSASAEKSSKHPLTVKDESLFIPVSGGIRISNSAGIGFTYLGSARKTFYLEGDTVLAAAPDNRIVPVVGSFLNAYSRGLGTVNLGGSFGICVAFQETLAINFMFGATAVFGRKEKLLLSAGLVLAPVTALDKGYYVGMHTTNPDFPTKMDYRPGIFFCIHYNVGKF